MSNLISLSEAAEFVGISRPTFNVRRIEYKFSEVHEGNKTLIPKCELLKLYSKENHRSQYLNLILTEDDTLEKIFVDENTLDLRLINFIDGYGIITLITTAAAILESDKSIYIIFSDNHAVRVLKAAGFFSELKKRFENRVFYNQDIETIQEIAKPFLSLHYIGFKGQERKILEDLIPLFQNQNFSTDVIGHLGWITGELVDNSLTHAQGPCYILIGQFNSKNKYLEVAIGDTGKGIYSSLKQNPKHQALGDDEAFLKAFKSKISSWPDTAKRGKGLCDLLIIAIGNGALLRVDSKEKGLMFNFINGQKEVMRQQPASTAGGARFCLLLINEKFNEVNREEVDKFVERETERLCKI